MLSQYSERPIRMVTSIAEISEMLYSFTALVVLKDD
jgi:hypothetical protein